MPLLTLPALPSPLTRYRAPDVLMGSRKYSTPVDIWSIGCIFAEMVNGQPLLPGASEADQLQKIFKMFGTPNSAEWKGVKELPDWKEDFPVFKPQSLKQVCPALDDLGIDLLSKLMQLDPAKRLSAEEALQHPYFSDLKQAQQ